jgi:hypothetical protein
MQYGKDSQPTTANPIIKMDALLYAARVLLTKARCKLMSLRLRPTGAYEFNLSGFTEQVVESTAHALKDLSIGPIAHDDVQSWASRHDPMKEAVARLDSINLYLDCCKKLLSCVPDTQRQQEHHHVAFLTDVMSESLQLTDLSTETGLIDNWEHLAEIISDERYLGMDKSLGTPFDAHITLRLLLPAHAYTPMLRQHEEARQGNVPASELARFFAEVADEPPTAEAGRRKFSSGVSLRTKADGILREARGQPGLTEFLEDIFRVTLLYWSASVLFEQARDIFDHIGEEQFRYDAERERYSTEEFRTDCISVIHTYGADTLTAFYRDLWFRKVEEWSPRHLRRHLKFHHSSKPVMMDTIQEFWLDLIENRKSEFDLLLRERNEMMLWDIFWKTKRNSRTHIPVLCADLLNSLFEANLECGYWKDRELVDETDFLWDKQKAEAFARGCTS